MDKERVKSKMSNKEMAFWGKYAEKLLKYGVSGHNAEWHVRRAQQLNHSLRALFASQIIFALRFKGLWVGGA